MTTAAPDAPITGRISLRSFLLVTTGLLFLTVVMGVSARATGSGLACNANWPLCDGGLLNLLPASMPSFFEWFHRVVAGVAGLFALGSTGLAWRRRASPGVRWGVSLGTALVPLQVLLGRETVLSFVPPVLAAHYWTAMTIYAAFVVATTLAWRDALDRRHVLGGLVLSLVSVPLVVLLAPPVVTSYTPPLQATQYVFVLAGFAGLLGATVVTWREPSRERELVRIAAVLFPLVVFFGRQRLVTPDLPVGIAHEVTAFVLFVSIASALALSLRSNGARAGPAGDRG